MDEQLPQCRNGINCVTTVVGHELVDLLPENASVCIDIGDRDMRAVDKFCAWPGDRTGEWIDLSKIDRSNRLASRRAGARATARDRGSQCDDKRSRRDAITASD